MGFEVTTPSVLKKIISGGQTGADRAALDWAIAHGIAHGGWCPRERRAEDGAIDARYRLQETESPHYRQRTGYNVEDSDGTLVLNLGPLTGGTLETIRFAERLGKPCLLLALDAGATPADAQKLSAWLGEKRISTLNIAGPREGKRPGMYAATYRFLDTLAAGSLSLDGRGTGRG